MKRKKITHRYVATGAGRRVPLCKIEPRLTEAGQRRARRLMDEIWDADRWRGGRS